MYFKYDEKMEDSKESLLSKSMNATKQYVFSLKLIHFANSINF